MISVTDLRRGVKFQLDGIPYQVLEYNHVKMGRGGATIRLTVRNLKSGSTETKTFNSGAVVEPITTVKRRLQYLYLDGSSAIFMDPKTYDQVEISRGAIGPELEFLKEGQEVDVLFWSFDSAQDKDVPLGIDLPPSVVLKVVEADPGVKGNSATNIYKQIKLENGLSVKAPLFIKVGDRVRVDTRSGEYIERAQVKNIATQS